MPAAFQVDSRSTFALPVEFHRPGSVDKIQLRFSVQHLKLSEVSALEKTMREALTTYSGDDFIQFKSREEAKVVFAIASSWDAESEFNVYALAEMFDLYPSAYPAFAKEYSAELMGLREKS